MAKPVRQVHPPGGALWRDRSFVLFWLARGISIAGTTVTTTVLPILVYQLSHSALLTSALFALDVIPYLLFGLVAGALADRVNRRRLMVGCDLINMLLLASIPLAAFAQVLSIVQIYVVGLLSATAFVWFDAANFGALPALAGRERLVAANSAIWASSTVLGIVVPGPAALLATTLGAAPTVSLDALSYACSAVALLLVPRAFQAARAEAEAPREGALVRRTLGEIRDGLIFLWRQRLVRTMVLLGFGNSFTTGAVTGLLVVYGVRALGLGVRDARLGFLFTAGAVGGLAASLVLTRLNQRFSPGAITLVGLFLTCGLLVVLALAPTYLTGVVALALWDACAELVILTGIALRQMVTPDHMQSRVNVAGRMIAWGGTPFGAAVGGVIAQVGGIRLAYLAMAGVLAVLCVRGWRSPLRDPLDVTG